MYNKLSRVRYFKTIFRVPSDPVLSVSVLALSLPFVAVVEACMDCMDCIGCIGCIGICTGTCIIMVGAATGIPDIMGETGDIAVYGGDCSPEPGMYEDGDSMRLLVIDFTICSSASCFVSASRSACNFTRLRTSVSISSMSSFWYSLF